MELVPSTCWFSNVRSEVSRAQWEKCKTLVRERSGDRCEICGGVGKKWPVEAHEKWHYDDQTHVQTLRGLIALCPLCHNVKHLGLTMRRGPKALIRAITHLSEVNQWDEATVMAYVHQAFYVQEQRSLHSWTLDISYLQEAGLVP